MLRSRKQLNDVVARAPAGFGSQPAKYRYDVVFLKEPLKAATALATVPRREASIRPGPGRACLLSRLIAQATKSQFGCIISLPIYKSLTIRNWNTTTKLLRLMDDTGTA